MNSTPKLVVLALGLVALIAACEEEVTVPPPPDPVEQIELSREYVRSGTGLPSNDVTAFLFTSTGEFWIGTNAGVAVYPDLAATERSELVNEISGLPHPQVRCIIEYAGKIYVGTWGGGLGVYDVTGGTWSQIRPATTGLTNGFIAGLAASPTEDLVYLASNDGVFIYDPGAATFTHFSTVDDDLDPDDLETPGLQKVVSSVEVQEDAGVVQRWYGPRVEVRLPESQAGLHGITVSKVATTFKYTKTNSGLVEPNVNDVFYDDVTSTFWVAYVNKGISQVDVTASTWKNYNLVHGLPSNTVEAITRAKDNESANTVIWAATQNGLAKLVNGHWESYGVSGGLPSDRLRSLYSDDGQRLWVGFVDVGAVRIK